MPLRLASRDLKRNAVGADRTAASVRALGCQRANNFHILTGPLREGLLQSLPRCKKLEHADSLDIGRCLNEF